MADAADPAELPDPENVADVDDGTTARRRHPMASVYNGADETCWLVAETPAEVADAVRAALRDPDPGGGIVELTLANASNWNGRTVYLDVETIRSIAPPNIPVDFDVNVDDPEETGETDDDDDDF